MSPDDVIPPEVSRALDEIGSAEVVVGIPSFDNRETVGRVVTAVEAGLRKHAADLDAVICISDGGSQDGTLDAALRSGVRDDHARLLVDPQTDPPRKIGFEYRGRPGKGSAVRSVMEVTRRLGARAGAVVDADLRSITPHWLDRLLGPVLRHGYGFVAPVYSRHKFDGTITNCIAFPVTSALYGVHLRQPIGGEFAFSGELARTYADEDVWDTDVARFGIDVWMTTVAIVEGFRTCQAILGSKIHDEKDPGKDLGPMFRQVIGSLFALAGRYADRWWEVDDVLVPPTFGFPAAYSAEPIKVSVPRLTWRFVEGYVRHQERWRRVLSEESMAGVARSVGDAAENTGGLVLDAELWTRIVYDFMVAYNRRDEEAGPLLDSLIPLYFARTATFVQQVRDDDYREAEGRVEEAAEIALKLKPYLRERWTGAGVPFRSLEDQPVPEDGEEPGDIERDLTSERP